MKLASLLILLFAYPLYTYANFKDGGDAYINGDFETAAEIFEDLANRGDHRAIYALGSMYAAGQGVEKNLKKAHQLFTEASQNGRTDAMYKLGLMYEYGSGIKKDTKKAIRLYRKSAQKGYPLSQYRFGLMYLNGIEVKQNPVNAYAWLVVAAHQFIYQYAADEHTSTNNAIKSKKYLLLLIQKQEKEKLLNEIIKYLQDLRPAMSTSDIEKIYKKVKKFSKYRWKHVPIRFQNIQLTPDIENLFLPETLQ